ncbi:MAG: 1-acylglycerol-3-phosphate O-acyltransferase [Bacilli bacterium]|jgi:1-acyl-sn-glycerol-3-phosphate acyltransferase|nr:1-acylglycerol-3-phosphate O-acyltransferase [Bacilli bacterium]
MKMFIIIKAILKNYFNILKNLKVNDLNKNYNVLKKINHELVNNLHLNIEVINLNKTKLDSCFIICNHQDYNDIFCLIETFKQPIKFIAKKELFKLPLFNKFIKLSNSYSLDRNDSRQGVNLFKQVSTDVKNNKGSVVVFPEGTRNKSKLFLEFNTGLFSIMKRNKLPILPIYISYKDNNVRIVINELVKANEYQELSSVELKDVIFNKISKLKKEYNLNNDALNIMGLGDSITAGEDYLGNITKGYYQRVIDYLDNEGLVLNSNNKAISGIDSAYLNNYLDNKELINDIKKTNLIMMSIGANDILKIVKKGKITKEDLLNEYHIVFNKTKKIIEKIIVINNNIKIILMGLYFPYPHSKVFQIFNDMDLLNNYYKNIASTYKQVSFINVADEIFNNKDSFLPSKRNIHLSDKGYEYLTKKVINELRGIL